MAAGGNGASKVNFCAIAEIVVCIFNLGTKTTGSQGLILDETISLCWIVVCKLNLQCKVYVPISRGEDCSSCEIVASNSGRKGGRDAFTV